MKPFSFPKSKRLVSSGQFKAVLDRKFRAGDELLVLYAGENDCGYPRLGVSVNKSLGNAVARNRLKRLLREVFRKNQNRIPAGFDYLLMISPQWLQKSNKTAEGKEAVKRLQFKQVEISFLALVDNMMKRLPKTQ